MKGECNMKENINEDLRKKMNEAVERWCDYMDRDQCIEKMIDEIDSIKKKNTALHMTGFAFRLNKKTRNFYVIPIWEGETNPNFGEKNNPLGRCSKNVFFEVDNLWNGIPGVVVLDNEDEELFMCEVKFI